MKIGNRFVVICTGEGLNPLHSHHMKLEIGRRYLAEYINDTDLSIRSIDDKWIGFYNKSHFLTIREYNLQKLLNDKKNESR